MGTFDYEWEDGSEFGFTYWQPSEPNYDGECIMMSQSYSYQWYDTACKQSYNSYKYVCKRTYTK